MYFETDEYGNFILDRKLGFDIETFDCKKKWSEISSAHLNEKCDWNDLKIDMSLIPPSLFLVAVVNSYSQGNMIYIPIDMSLSTFIAQAKKVLIETMLMDTRTNAFKLYNFGVLSVFKNVFSIVQTLHRTCKLDSTKQWNRIMAKEGFVWVVNVNQLNKCVQYHAIEDIIDFILNVKADSTF